MCLPWNHKWETTDSVYKRTYSNDDLYAEFEPVAIYKIITQRCTHCGKEIVRKYRV